MSRPAAPPLLPAEVLTLAEEVGTGSRSGLIADLDARRVLATLATDDPRLALARRWARLRSSALDHLASADRDRSTALATMRSFHGLGNAPSPAGGGPAYLGQDHLADAAADLARADGLVEALTIAEDYPPMIPTMVLLAAALAVEAGR